MCRDLLSDLTKDTRDRLTVLALSEEDDGEPIMQEQKPIRLSNVIKQLQPILDQLNTFESLTHQAIPQLESLLTKFEALVDLQVPIRYMRLRLICENALKRAAEIRSKELDMILTIDDFENAKSDLFEKNVKQVETLCKLTMQKLVNNFRQLGESDEPSQRKASLTADNSVINVAATVEPADKESVAEEETTIENMLEFSESLVTVLQEEKTQKLGQKAN